MVRNALLSPSPPQERIVGKRNLQEKCFFVQQVSCIHPLSVPAMGNFSITGSHHRVAALVLPVGIGLGNFLPVAIRQAVEVVHHLTAEKGQYTLEFFVPFESSATSEVLSR